jgi:hypothetical protein
MTQLTWSTGCAGDELSLPVDWFNHNNVRQRTIVTIAIQRQDKPRQLEVRVNGVVVAVIPSDETR